MSPADFEKYVHLEIEKIKNQMSISFDSGVQAERKEILNLIQGHINTTSGLGFKSLSNELQFVLNLIKERDKS
jgi:hypothetical protein